MYQDQAYNLQIWDTAGQEDYKKLRPLSYPQTDVFIIAFSLTDSNTFDNVETSWVPEIKEHCPNTPYILVGTKSDLRDNPSEGITPIPMSKGEQLKTKIGAYDYIECSAMKSINLKEVFESAIKNAVNPSLIDTKTLPNNDGCCNIL
jgi:small GTP-binding protein